MEKKIKRKIIWDESGVTEIIGDILILSMTVVLFASVFIFVWTLPTPNQDTYAEFDASLELTGGSGTINITHVSGETLLGAYTKIFTFKNGDTDVRMLDTQGSDADNPAPGGYGLNDDDDWDPGDKWTYYMSGITEDDSLDVAIIDEKQNTLIMKAQLLSSSTNLPSIVMERYYSPYPAVNTSAITIYARVLDSPGGSGIDSVYANVSALNSSMGIIDMTDSDNDGTYQATFDVFTEPGSYTLTIVAKDKANNIDRRRLTVTVLEKGRDCPVIAVASIEPNIVPLNDNFIVRAYVIDPNDDLDDNSVYVNMSTIGGGLKKMAVTSNPGVFQAVGTAPAVEGTFNFKVNATDLAGHKASASVPLTVKNLAGSTAPSGSYNGTWNTTLGGIGFGESTPYGDYGYDIFNVSGLPTSGNPGGDGTRYFDVGERVYCRVRSTVLQNLINKNSFILRDVLGNIVASATIEYDYTDSSTWPNYPGAFYKSTETMGIYFEYRYDFSTTGFTPGAYSVEIKMEDNQLGGAGHHFYASDMLYIGVNASSAVPKIELYYDSDDNGYDDDDPLWNDYNWWGENPPFGVNTVFKMYVKLIVQDANNPPVLTGDIEVEDFFGGNQIKARPGNYPVGEVEKHNDTSYIFPIDLIGRNGDIWLPGMNWYTIRIRSFEDDTNDNYKNTFTLAKITAPMKNIDIVTTIKSKKDGGAVSWYRGDDWPRSSIQDRTEKHAEALAIGDIDGDGDYDVAVGTDDDKRQNIAWFENIMADGSVWVAHFLDTDPLDDGKKKAKFPKCVSLAIADLDNDGDSEIIAGMSNDIDGGMGVHIFVNDGFWTDTVLSTDGAAGWSSVLPITQHVDDDTGEDIADAQSDDNSYYNVSSSGGTTLYFNEWGTPPATKLDGKDKVLAAKLWVTYMVDNESYSGTNWIQYDDGGWVNGIEITNESSEFTDSCDLPGAFNEFKKLGDLKARFINDDGSGGGATLYFNAKGGEDTWAPDLAKIETDDGTTDDEKNKVLHVTTPFDTSGLAGPFASVGLKIKYKTEAGFTGIYTVKYRNSSAGSWYNTTITFSENMDFVTVIDPSLISYGFTSKADIDNLEIKVDHIGGNKKIKFDCINVIVTTSLPINVNIDKMWIEYQPEGGGKKVKIGEIAVGDLDNDGWMDIVTADENGDTRVFINEMDDNPYNYSAFQQRAVPKKGGGKQQHIRLGYMEGDSDSDLDIVRNNDHEVWIHPNDGGGNFGAGEIDVNLGGTITKKITAIAVGDMNNDNKTDIVVGTEMPKTDDPSKLWVVLQGDTWSVPADWDFYPVMMDQVYEWIKKTGKDVSVGDVEVGDTDGDGDLDIAVGMGLKKRSKELTSNLWHFVNNCTAATWGDPDGATGPANSQWIMWYRQEEVPINPWDKGANEEVYNVEMGYIDLT